MTDFHKEKRKAYHRRTVDRSYRQEEQVAPVFFVAGTGKIREKYVGIDAEIGAGKNAKTRKNQKFEEKLHFFQKKH